ncbi:protein BIC1-like [Prunus avium]|uniref:Protein BIC1-like n=1 Tax=Prunus avium TaxID=42229 RepID=A0A6P5TRU3_PRUAV|nr:protein BIC1-like [Prunus avium]
MKRTNFSFLEENPNNIINMGSQQIPAFSGKRTKHQDPNNLVGFQSMQQPVEFHGDGGDHQVHYLSGRERLKRHQEEVAGRVAIPDSWDQEELLKDWIDYSPFDALLVPKGLTSAREALAMEGRRASGSQGVLRIESRC